MATRPEDEDPLAFEEPPTLGSRLLDILAAGARGYGEGAGNSRTPESSFAKSFSTGYDRGKEARSEGRLTKAISSFQKTPDYAALTPTEKTAFRASPGEFLKERGINRGGGRTFVGVQGKNAVLMDKQGAFTLVPLPDGSPLRPKTETPKDPAVESAREDLKRTRGLNFASDLRKEFINRPEVKDAVTVATNIKSMDSLLANAVKGDQRNQLALDQALITMFNKLTDPNSVVRESEYARTPENIPAVNRIEGALRKLQAGGAGITNEDRQALVLGAKIIGNERFAQSNATRKSYEELAKNAGVDNRLITGTISEYSPFDIGGGASSGGGARTAQAGKTVPQISGGAKSYATEADAQAAAEAGILRPGDKVIVGGQSGVWE